MIKLNKIYTRKGDKGSTSLGDGKKVLKHSSRVEAYGAVDEANAFIGLTILKTTKEIKKILLRIQNDLFDLGADLCTPEKENVKKLKITSSHINFIEKKIDFYNKSLFPLKSFVLPGGNSSSVFFHLARTVVRRAERKVSHLLKKEKINPHTISYLNRLSDLLFVLARYSNNKGKKDVLWVPGKNIGKN